jgi:hypothetical protein
MSAMRCGALLAVVLVVACAQSGRQPAVGAPSLPSGPDVVDTYRACFGAVPADWSRRFQAHRLAVGGVAAFSLGAVAPDGSAAFGTYRLAATSGVGAVDLTSGVLTRVAPLPAEAVGAGWMADASPWLVWEEADSRTDPGDWTIHAWNQETHAVVNVASSRLPDGREVSGQTPQPAVGDGLVAWAQPLAPPGSQPQASVQVLDLRGGGVTVLDSGRVSDPVFAGPYLVWARANPNGSYALRAVDAWTLGAASLPGRVSAAGEVLALAGSARYLVWSTALDRLHAWRIGTNQYADYTTDARHPLQLLAVAGDFVLWYTGQPSSVLDLRTGHAFDLPGAVAGADPLIVESDAPSRLAYSPLSADSQIAAC